MGNFFPMTEVEVEWEASVEQGWGENDSPVERDAYVSDGLLSLLGGFADWLVLL